MNKIKEKLRNEFVNFKETDGIAVILNEKYINGDNQKYMKMYDWMLNIHY
jgi:hypothetical protein